MEKNDKNSAKIVVQELVKKYEEVLKSEVKKYTEEETKKDFILPLFEALGWREKRKSKQRLFQDLRILTVSKRR